MANESNKPGQMQFELTPEVAKGTYANLVMIAHSSSEFIVDFVNMFPGLPKPTIQSRVILAPEHAKRLMYALQDNINKYEQTFGPIRLPEPAQKGRTIAPFGTPQGEA